VVSSDLFFFFFSVRLLCIFDSMDDESFKRRGSPKCV